MFSYFVVVGRPREFVLYLVTFSLTCLMIWDAERNFSTGSSRFQIILMGESHQPLMIYKHNMRRWSHLLTIYLSTKQGSFTTRSWSGFLLFLFWYFMKHLLALLVMNRLVSTIIQPIIPSTRKLFLLLQTQ